MCVGVYRQVVVACHTAAVAKEGLLKVTAQHNGSSRVCKFEEFTTTNHNGIKTV